MKLEHVFAALDRQIHKFYRSMENDSPDKALSFSEYDYLKTIQELDRPRLSSIAEAMLVQKPSATNMVRRLEGRELVKRSPCPEDGRAVCILLTNKGHSILAYEEQLYASLANSARKQLSAEECDTLSHLLERLAR